jgi:hypothetical protein
MFYNMHQPQIGRIQLLERHPELKTIADRHGGQVVHKRVFAGLIRHLESDSSLTNHRP